MGGVRPRDASLLCSSRMLRQRARNAGSFNPGGAFAGGLSAWIASAAYLGVAAPLAAWIDVSSLFIVIFLGKPTAGVGYCGRLGRGEPPINTILARPDHRRQSANGLSECSISRLSRREAGK